MERVIRIFLMMSSVISAVPLFSVQGQEKEGMVKYTPDFRFNDGIYLNFDQVKLNRPIPKAKLLTSVDFNDREFFKRVLESDKIFFYEMEKALEQLKKNPYLPGMSIGPLSGNSLF